ncbi:hypothetical protein ACGIF2_09440 [Cellulomonas sp. P22]|uniref:RsiG family protein n=1 Tax=Cellulomonas sp. P22 TaxID=3373189 RepID=UPI0037BB2EB6
MPPVVSTLSHCSELRSTRRALRAESTRVGWWRRLVQARLDLAVAAVAPPEPLGEEMALFALPDDRACAPQAAELFRALRGDAPAVEVSQLTVLRDLDERLACYERHVDEALARITEELVQALSADPLTTLDEIPEAPRLA